MVGIPDRHATPAPCTQSAAGLGLAGVGGTGVLQAQERAVLIFKEERQKAKKQKGKAIKAKLPQLLLISENNKEIDLTLLRPSLTPFGLCFYSP